MAAVPIRDPKELEAAFGAVTREGADALVILGDTFTVLHRQQLVSLAARHRLPTVYAYREFVMSGGLMSFGPDLTEMFRSAAIYTDKVLRGAKPADLPVEQPTKFELVINRETAKALGLTIPQSLLLRADQVIE
jgi:putative tryptophan/tyrosine transport system substrate-binding protein